MALMSMLETCVSRSSADLEEDSSVNAVDVRVEKLENNCADYQDVYLNVLDLQSGEDSSMTVDDRGNMPVEEFGTSP